MQAILCRELAGPDALILADLPAPEPGACHVRLRVVAAGVNFADSLITQGRYQEKPSLPFVPGLEAAGRIEKIGAGVQGFEPGQRVLALFDHGAFAEAAIARADDVVPLPETMDDATAAGFAIVYGTAYGALAWRAGLLPGETLLVHGAASGVGLAAVECGKAMKARVIATARGEARLRVAAEHGADAVIDGDHPELVAEIRRLAPSGVDVAFDPVGGTLFDAALRCMAWEGRIVTIGFASGTVPQIPANHLLVKNVAVFGFYFGSYRRRDPARLRQGFETLFGWHAAGRIRPLVAHRLKLADAALAIGLLTSRRATGKVVLTT
ncbi:MAG: NADPH:quinone oxidoreductase family protein [Geminicoccaceae bacterium]|nr:NADPH:quinone oxidoreductase family protein [Geminicoccaceae bacterium]